MVTSQFVKSPSLINLLLYVLVKNFKNHAHFWGNKLLKKRHWEILSTYFISDGTHYESHHCHISADEPHRLGTTHTPPPGDELPYAMLIYRGALMSFMGWMTLHE